MAPVYAHCPRCDFPAVVSAVEREVRRICRQCGGKYMPAKLDQPDGWPTGRNDARVTRARRRRLRARLERGQV